MEHLIPIHDAQSLSCLKLFAQFFVVVWFYHFKGAVFDTVWWTYLHHNTMKMARDLLYTGISETYHIQGSDPCWVWDINTLAKCIRVAPKPCLEVS